MPTTYIYDGKGRLLKDQTTGSGIAHVYTYAYDDCDNRILSTETGAPVTYTYDLAGRLQSSTDGKTYAYDANGNMTMVTGGANPVTMIYDKESRMTVHKEGGTVRTYTFDGDGKMRSEQIVGSPLTTIVWDGEDYLQLRS